LVIDIGATNVRTVVLNNKGEIYASATLPNNTKRQFQNKDWLIWDIEEIWQKIKNTTTQILKNVNKENIKAITVTTFGADGTFFDKSGNMLYPVISWQCNRTAETLKKLKKKIPIIELFKISGQQMFIFNTILRFLWMKENEPKIYEKADKFLMMPGIIEHKLTGEFAISVSSGSTMMMLDLKKREFSEKILKFVNKSRDIFPKLYEAGDVMGVLKKDVAEELNLNPGIPVVVSGHDTQFALYGSGVNINEPVLSSGTWEILLVRTDNVKLNKNTFDNSVNIEFDVLPGLYNPSAQWIASGGVEWIRNNFYIDLKEKEEIYEIMTKEAEKIKPSLENCFFYPAFVPEGGVQSKYKEKCIIRNIKLTTTRGEIFRSLMEGLSFQLKDALEILQRSCNFKAKKIIVVGGGSKNMLWNKIRADVLGLPVVTIKQKESTVLGAALFAFKGAGIYKTADEARTQIDFGKTEIIPNKENYEIYQKLYQKFKNLRKIFSQLK
jgi:L-fuculokinase